jgi:uncharacterized surface protein with fasciclin (FAS1) repeats
MIDRRDSLRLLLLASAGLGLAACGGGDDGARSAAPGGGTTVLDVARANGLGRLVRGAPDAGLAETLAGPGPYTLFAPSHRALGEARLPRDAAALRELIAYHVVPGTFTTAFLAGVDLNYATLAGTSLNVDGTGSPLLVNGTPVVTPDLLAANGVVHVIDRVLAPR